MAQETEFQFTSTLAQKEDTPALITLWGGTGSGKTLSALKLARGLAGPDGMIMVADTENKRALFYAEESAPWHHVDLQPPFTPAKYEAAAKWMQHKGAKVIIVDSQSHVWQGEGGVLEMADRNSAKGQMKWKDPKLSHQRMMNALCRSRCHMIFCCRQKEVMKTVRIDGKDQYVFDKFSPIVEKNFIFEQTVALRVTGEGYYDRPLIGEDAADKSRETYYKVPKGLKNIIPIGGRIDEEMGRKIGEYMAEGVKRDEEQLQLIQAGQEIAYDGMDAYKAWFEKLTKEQRAKVLSRHEDFKSTAAAVDQEKINEALEEETNQLFSVKESVTKEYNCVICDDKGMVTTPDGKEPCDCQK